ncbi:unnamed protein product [Moneuplotes crassus]|uniref:Uncharacterized protein n=1 Tax=Euplotes crassus TaxID=5936 RepID=A0AAD1XL13_EUPCR|nr:unnamed protein product [Moneuplotes crassus]
MYNPLHAASTEKIDLFQKRPIFPILQLEVSLQDFCQCDYKKIHRSLPNCDMKIDDIYCLQKHDTSNQRTPTVPQVSSQMPSLQFKNANKSEYSEDLGSSSGSQISPISSFSIVKLSRRQMKTIERNFTNSNARKDVVYKAILRFFRRECQFEVKQMRCRYSNYEQMNGVSCNHLDEKSTTFLQEVLGLSATHQLKELFSVLISFNPIKPGLAASSYVFNDLLTNSVKKFNKKNLGLLFSNELLAKVFLAFWKNQQRFQQMVTSLNQKRIEEINQRAFRYYLNSLLHTCTQTLNMPTHKDP